MKKFPTNLKKILFFILIIVGFILLFNVLHFIKYAIDEDDCVDSGICAEGLRFGNDVMSKEYCIEKGKKWDDKRKECEMAIESRVCREQGYEWRIEKGECSHKIIKNW